mmetsp:Transcript_49678/g.91942  ORF Transcript_49678/g.91942 Transcript_49678/m.91942 type:complete len:95 (+) Transcript_49678:96-380(+)
MPKWQYGYYCLISKEIVVIIQPWNTLGFNRASSLCPKVWTSSILLVYLHFDWTSRMVLATTSVNENISLLLFTIHFAFEQQGFAMMSTKEYRSG